MIVGVLPNEMRIIAPVMFIFPLAICGPRKKQPAARQSPGVLGSGPFEAECAPETGQADLDTIAHELAKKISRVEHRPLG
jgi:hypothetical protein